MRSLAGLRSSPAANQRLRGISLALLTALARARASTTLRSLAEGPGPQVALVAGASDFAPGEVRYPFLVVDKNGASIERPTARVWLARGLDQQPFEQQDRAPRACWRPGRRQGDVSNLYVARLKIPSPGKYWVLAKPIGGRAIQGLGNLIVRRNSFSPAIGSKAYPSRTPTLESVRGNASLATTRVPPDTDLLQYSIAGSLAAHKPFVVVFATPKFCTSRTCGPVVDVVDAVRKRFSSTASASFTSRSTRTTTQRRGSIAG